VKLDQPLRFRVLQDFNSEAVLDKETGLVWQKTPFVGAFSSVQAWFKCMEATTGGRMGWRVPSAEELLSLQTKVGNSFVLPPGHPFSVSTGEFYAQSSSQYTLTNGTVTRMVIVFNSVAPLFTLSSGLGDASVWCVRGGASAPQTFKGP
jgi:hypothetical protein